MKKYFPFIILLSILSVTIVFLSTQKRQAAQTTQPASFIIPTATIVPEISIFPEEKELSLSVSEPLPNAVVTVSTITVRGVTSPKADVFVNELETVADSTGAFRVNVLLEEGENYIVVMANDENGLSAETELSVRYQVPLE